MGDPSGIGPEVALKALSALPSGEILLIGDADIWRRTQEMAGITAEVRAAQTPGPVAAGVIPFLHLPAEEGWQIGSMSPGWRG
jgi:4-hydroxy-L-threonine phosphate dehydrogenase PdxA